jgi:hypothetical protein
MLLLLLLLLLLLERDIVLLLLLTKRGARWEHHIGAYVRGGGLQWVNVRV